MEVTRGRPSVTVPVLSSTTVVTLRARCNASPLRIRIPCSAAFPMPTIMEIGVARPSAHGQAITSTVMAVTMLKAVRGSGPKLNHSQEGHDGNQQHDGHEHAGHLIDQTRYRRPGSLCRAHHVDDVRQYRVPADAAGPEQETAGPVERAADHLVPGGLVHREWLAGQHGFIDAGAPFDDDPIDRNLLAGMYADGLVETDLLDGYVRFLPVADHTRGTGLQADEFSDGLR